MPELTLNSTAFRSGKDVAMTKEAWLAKIQSPQRIVAETHLTLSGKPIMVWAFFAGHDKKVYKTVIEGDKDAHKDWHGQIHYFDTAAEALAKHDELVNEIKKV